MATGICRTKGRLKKKSRVWRPSRKGEAGLKLPKLHQTLNCRIHYMTQARDVELPGSQLNDACFSSQPRVQKADRGSQNAALKGWPVIDFQTVM